MMTAKKIDLILVLCLCSPSFGAAKFSIASKGQPKAEIVVPENAEPSVAFAAEELQRYVKMISGAELPLVHSTSKKPAIVLINKPLEKEESHDPREEDHYRLTIDAKKLQIEGATPRAVLFGAYDVLERLGCGWCVPGDDAIPKDDTLELAALEVDTRPAFEYRMMLDFPLLTTEQSIAIVDWIAKNRMNWVHPCPNAHGEPKTWYDRRERVVPELKKRGLHLILGGHTTHTWVPESNFAAHPDWFFHDGTERKPPTLCISNLEMTQECIKNMRLCLDRCPEIDVIDLWNTDNSEFCHCSKCTRGVLPDGTKEKPTTSAPTSPMGDAVLVSFTISYVEFVNRVAEAIGKSHPKVMIGPLIYSQTDRAMPDGAPRLADNVLLGLAHFYRDSYRTMVGEPKSPINMRFLGEDLTWFAKAKHSFVYEYYNCWIGPYIYPGAHVIAKDIETFQQLKFQGSSSDMFGYSPINMYVAARALWNPGTSWKESLREFCLRFYGDVGEEMAANQLRLETGIFGKNGYQSDGARAEIEKWPDMPKAGLYLQQQRPGQITFLKGLIEKTKDPQVKVRLERDLKPWSLWSDEPRFWAFPEFKPAQ